MKNLIFIAFNMPEFWIYIGYAFAYTAAVVFLSVRIAVRIARGKS